MDDCVFCDLEFRKNAYLENDFFIAIFDFHPVSPGHSLIIPKKHIVELAQLQPQEWIKLFSTTQDAIKKIESTDLKEVYRKIIKLQVSEISVSFCEEALNHPRINTKPDAYNHGLNDGKAAGRTVNHLHWHIIPRFEGDVDDPRGGVRFVIPNKGNYKIPR